MFEVKIVLTSEAFVEMLAWKRLYQKKRGRALDVRNSDVVNAALMALKSKGPLNVETQLALMDEAVSQRRQKEGGAI